MSGGLPSVPDLSSFGPFPKENAIPVKNPKTSIDADVYSLMIWQVAGLSQIAFKATGVLDGTGGVLTLFSHAESFNPKRDVSLAPTPLYVNTGRYQLTFPTSAPDDSGNVVSLVYKYIACVPMAQSGLAFGAIGQAVALGSFTANVASIELHVPASSYVNGPLFYAVL